MPKPEASSVRPSALVSLDTLRDAPVGGLARRTVFGTVASVAGKNKREAPSLTCRFYRTDGGSEPVRDWLKSLPAAVRKEIGSDIQQVQWRWPVGKPLVDGLGSGLFEIRTTAGGDIYRVLFCFDGSTLVLLHGFKKKSRQTPKPDLDLARKRKKELEED
jgi:phage-related protein